MKNEKDIIFKAKMSCVSYVKNNMYWPPFLLGPTNTDYQFHSMNNEYVCLGHCGHWYCKLFILSSEKNMMIGSKLTI